MITAFLVLIMEKFVKWKNIFIYVCTELFPLPQIDYAVKKQIECFQELNSFFKS